MDLTTRLGPLELRNPIVLASGTAGYGRDLAEWIDLERIGALTVKGLSLFPCPGNPPPRLHETYAGIMNSIGLENKGLHRFLAEDLPFLEGISTRVIVNIWGRTSTEYIRLAASLNRLSRVDAVEVNVSCPNIEKGGISYSADRSQLVSLVEDIRRVLDKPMIVKLGPGTAELRQSVRDLQKADVDILSLTNTFPAVAVDLKEKKTVFPRRMAGLSGPAIKPLALWLLDEVRYSCDLPIIGMGGIMRAEDAVEFLLLGARAVGVGTATLLDPRASIRILEGLQAYIRENGLHGVDDIIGKAR
ncbi:MAG TPA: dihydroorotate dehydrogenase [Atribacteraceae bacterium]|nr:dihydroorotate dehydrogenase [Atribacteraceae bacterium]